MKATGIVRRIDELGRVVIPKEIRRTLRIKEGDPYKCLTAFGKTFQLYYGYYDEIEREGRYSEPLPLYPDFVKEPQYSEEGHPFVTQMQDACAHYEGCPRSEECAACRHYLQGDELIGLCLCEKNRRDPSPAAVQAAPNA